MEPVIKIDLDKAIKGPDPVIVELGCGDKKKFGGIGIDKVDLPDIDIVADIENGLSFLPDNSVDCIHCRSVFEHIENFESLMREIVRVLKGDGEAHVFVPHFSNPHYCSDYTHIRFFGLYSFYYFVAREGQLKRKVPEFYSDIRIKVLSQKLKFRSSFWFLSPLKKVFGRIINIRPWVQEYYEENLCYIFPCHGIEVVFGPGDL